MVIKNIYVYFNHNKDKKEVRWISKMRELLEKIYLSFSRVTLAIVY